MFGVTKVMSYRHGTLGGQSAVGQVEKLLVLVWSSLGSEPACFPCQLAAHLCHRFCASTVEVSASILIPSPPPFSEEVTEHREFNKQG